MMKRFLTWLTPSASQLHLWNYFGALRPMLELRKQHSDAEFFLFLSNLHALTKDEWSAASVRENSYNLLKIYLATWFDPDKFFIYRQSDISAHAELAWIFECITHMGFMERMHAYKDAVNKWKSKELSVGTFAYPILMAVDIILYDATHIPVGKDQKQHVEYAKDIAQKFNHQFGNTFVLPDPYIQEDVATVPGTDGRKMSKSYNNFIWLLDDADLIRKKVSRIPTAAIPIDASKNPDEDNLYKIRKLFLNEEEDAELRTRYERWGLSYKDAKAELTQKIVEFITPIQERFTTLEDWMIDEILQKNAIRANEIAKKKVDEVYKLVGLR